MKIKVEIVVGKTRFYLKNIVDRIFEKKIRRNFLRSILIL